MINVRSFARVVLLFSLLAGISFAQNVEKSDTSYDQSPIGLINGPDLSAASTKATRFIKTPAEQADVREASKPVILPKLQITQFQKFISQGTQQNLDLFGYNLFESRTGVTQSDQQVSSSHILGVGDELLVKIWGAFDYADKHTIDRSGHITLPKLGPIRIAGTQFGQLDTLLAKELARVFKNVQVTATMGKLHDIQIYQVGQARLPGAHLLSGNTTLLSALFKLGGPSALGSMRNIQLVRSGQTLLKLDLYEFILQGHHKALDLRLLPGDVILFPAVGPRVALKGAIDVPAIYELDPQGSNLGQILNMSGNVSALTAGNRAVIERVDPHQSMQGLPARLVKDVSLDHAGLQTHLQDADVVTLLPVSPQFANAVTLRGNVAIPIRHVFKEGMRISDLIPNSEMLIQRDYFEQQNRLNNTDQNVTDIEVLNQLKSRLKEINWDYASIERMDSSSVKTQLIPFNLERAIKYRDSAHNLVLKPGDVVTVYGVDDLPIPLAKRSQFVKVAGEVNVPGVYPIYPGEKLNSFIQRIGGFTPNAYLYGTVFLRESTRKQQQNNLDKAIKRIEAEMSSQYASIAQSSTEASASLLLQREQMETQKLIAQRLKGLKASGRISLNLEPKANSLPDLILEDGDVIQIPSVSSFVGVYGSVMGESALIHDPQKSVQDYVERAGATREADLDNVLVIRADGSAVGSSHSVFSWISSSVMGLTLQPGDSIFVPETLDKRTPYAQFMQYAKDWTQLIYQFGLGAAALETLRN